MGGGGLSENVYDYGLYRCSHRIRGLISEPPHVGEYQMYACGKSLFSSTHTYSHRRFTGGVFDATKSNRVHELFGPKLLFRPPQQE